ncbi:hypothetical protein EK21DRAFT_119162 [Setomelanomma holmii]|uniref:Uncharacterized protein n=1 Tax=Setomelanomma holmii TaxID=210430 RepID=A0A9P4GXL3_9PLEO|nr:hypothetical protein EK21DRAFT_119162 [Setomelanomma holmii]
MSTTSTETPSPPLSEEEFLAKLDLHAKFKQRFHDTHYNTHIHELNARLNLGLDLAPPQTTEHDASPRTPDPFASIPDLANKKTIEVVYLGNSMLERLKTTGKCTRLAGLVGSWKAGCGGDRNENVAWRLREGLYEVLRSAQEGGRCDIKLWVLIAPKSRVLACAFFYRKDIRDGLVDEANEMMMMMRVIEPLRMKNGEQRVFWYE